MWSLISLGVFAQPRSHPSHHLGYYIPITLCKFLSTILLSILAPGNHWAEVQGAVILPFQNIFSLGIICQPPVTSFFQLAFNFWDPLAAHSSNMKVAWKRSGIGACLACSRHHQPLKQPLPPSFLCMDILYSDFTIKNASAMSIYVQTLCEHSFYFLMYLPRSAEYIFNI